MTRPEGSRHAPVASAASDRRLRVLHIVLNLDMGGLERLVTDLARSIDSAAFETHVLCLRFFGREAKTLDNVAELHLAPRLPRYTMLWPARLIRKIEGLRPDVVHTHSGVWYKASLAARRAGVPRLVHTEHGRPHPDSWRARLVDRLASRRTDVVVAVSTDLAKQLEQGLQVDPRRIVVVRNGVDTSRFRPGSGSGALQRELGLAADVPVLGSVGRLDAVKAYDVLLRALVRLRADWGAEPLPVLVVVGEGPEGPGLFRLTSELGLNCAVHWLGWREDVPELLRSLDLFTLASWSEGTSLSLLEAMSSGVCPIVTAVGGNPDVLGDALWDRLVPPGDPEHLAAAWADALRHPDQRLRDGILARERVLEGFSLQAMVRRYERLYRGLKGESEEERR